MGTCGGGGKAMISDFGLKNRTWIVRIMKCLEFVYLVLSESRRSSVVSVSGEDHGVRTIGGRKLSKAQQSLEMVNGKLFLSSTNLDR